MWLSCIVSYFSCSGEAVVGEGNDGGCWFLRICVMLYVERSIDSEKIGDFVNEELDLVKKLQKVRKGRGFEVLQIVGEI